MLQATRRPIAETAASLPKFGADRWFSVAAMLLLVVAAVLFVAGVMRMADVLKTSTQISSVQIEGDLRHAESQVIANRVAAAAKGNYFSMDLAAIQTAAQSAPWVDEALVSRRWPDGVRIQVREKQPVALWGAGGLISSRGDLFVPSTAVNTTDLPILFGPGNKGTYVMEQYRAMNSILRGLGMHIVELQLTDRMSWFLRMDNGIHLVVDQVDTIEKLQRFAYLYERQLKPDAENIATIDLRYRNGVSVGWRVQKNVKVVPQAV